MKNKYRLIPAPSFSRDYKKFQRKHINIKNLSIVLSLFMNYDDNLEILRRKFRAHKLKGNNYGTYELHLAPNILLKY